MHGISPRPYTLTPTQKLTSAAITAALPDIPTTVSDLISEMATPDFPHAARSLELDTNGVVIENQHNQSIISSIEAALTAPSSECEPWIKSTIFSNATLYNGVLKSYLVQIINNLQRAGEQINLDDVTVENLTLRQADGFDLSGMSAQRTIFYHISFLQMKLEHADFTAARFIDSLFVEADLSNANVTGATFENVKIQGTAASELTGDQSKILVCSRTYPSKVVVDNVPTIVGNIYLNLDADYVVPDTDSYTLLPKKFPNVVIPQKQP